MAVSGIGLSFVVRFEIWSVAAVYQAKVGVLQVYQMCVCFIYLKITKDCIEIASNIASVY
jgi:hypothetical protein